MNKTNLKALVMIVAISMFASNLFAQGAYAKFGFGYGLSFGTRTATSYTLSTTTNNQEAVNFTLGKGLNIEGAFGYMFNKNIGAELGISYLIGGKTEIISSYLFMSGTTLLGIVNDSHTLSAKMLRINPTFVIKTDFEKINPYTKFGIIIGIGSLTDDNQTTYFSGDIRKYKNIFNGGIAIGFNAGAGVLYSLSDKISFFGELNMINMSYAPTKGEITECSYNGVDQLPNMTTQDKETEYVDSYDAMAVIPTSSPDKEIKDKIPFGSFGVNFGVKINL